MDCARQRCALDLSHESDMRMRHCPRADIREVHVRSEDADGAVKVVIVHNELPELHLKGSDLGGDLGPLADQVGQDVLI